MTPKEKAHQLITDFGNNLPDAVEIDKDVIKGCALQLVAEIIHFTEIKLGLDKSDFEYWYEVKDELNKI